MRTCEKQSVGQSVRMLYEIRYLRVLWHPRHGMGKHMVTERDIVGVRIVTIDIQGEIEYPFLWLSL